MVSKTYFLIFFNVLQPKSLNRDKREKVTKMIQNENLITK